VWRLTVCTSFSFRALEAESGTSCHTIRYILLLITTQVLDLLLILPHLRCPFLSNVLPLSPLSRSPSSLLPLIFPPSSTILQYTSSLPPLTCKFLFPALATDRGLPAWTSKGWTRKALPCTASYQGLSP